MPSFSFNTLTTLTVLATSALLQVRADDQWFSPDPLVDKVVPYNAIPYQVMTDKDDPRGFQTGYNICNSTTEGPSSMCQTMFVNHIDDFCLWAPPKPNTAIGDSEGEEVAWCSKPGHGTRVIPQGAITGLQFIQTPSYIQIAGTINQELLNIAAGDYGGELDSGGQDGEGNPMGGLVYSNAFPSNGGKNDTFQQAQHWSFFIGGNAFCGKVCDQTGKNPQGLCQNIYDRLGCAYNAPNTAKEGVFEVCQGDDMTPVGTYVVNGQTSVYHQPPETESITNVPYTPTPAPSSNCVTYTSSVIFSAAPTASVTPSASGSAAGASGTAKASGNTKGAAGASGTSSGAAGSTGTPGSNAKSGATSTGMGGFVGILVAGIAAAVGGAMIL